MAEGFFCITNTAPPNFLIFPSSFFTLYRSANFPLILMWIKVVDCWTPLTNLWWMPNSFSKSFGTCMKTGLSRRFKQYPTPEMGGSEDFHFLWILRLQQAFLLILSQMNLTWDSYAKCGVGFPLIWAVLCPTHGWLPFAPLIDIPKGFSS